MSDDFNLQRFVNAQQPIYAAALSELKGGRKQSHWMWFVFPQVAGLGRSTMAKHYAIRSRQEAAAYLAWPLLGTRLAECTRVVLEAEGQSAHDIFGSPDDLKFRSSMTLFDQVDHGGLYGRALDRFFAGKRDEATVEIMMSWHESPP
jgi:uncharacterized protein (DUF1810 family)